jgi:hypothetical protein
MHVPRRDSLLLLGVKSTIAVADMLREHVPERLLN